MIITELQTHCPECQAALIDDNHSCEKICSGCGLVAMEQMSDYGPESRASSPEDKMKTTRASGQTTYSQHDLGIRTEIAIGTKDFSGRTISSDVANQMYNLRKWQTRIRVASPRERRLANILSKIANLAKLEVRVERLAAEIAQKTEDHNLADGKAPNGLAAAYLYIASTLLGQSILQRDVSSVAGITEVTIRNRCKEILSAYKMKVTLRPSLTKN